MQNNRLILTGGYSVNLERNGVMEVPVYLVNGFLESGKTLFIDDALKSEDFADGDKTLLIACEEGMEEYDEKQLTPLQKAL